LERGIIHKAASAGIVSFVHNVLTVWSNTTGLTHRDRLVSKPARGIQPADEKDFIEII
jgi:hypothetical protein